MANTPRYTSPIGSGTACTAAAPCSIVTAIVGVPANPTASGNEVVIEPGSYGSPIPLTVDLADNGRFLNIHGVAGAPRPIINSSSPNALFLSGISTLSHVEINYTGGINALLQLHGTARDIVVVASGAGAVACGVYTTLTDSLCVATGPGASAVEWSSSSTGPSVVQPVLRGVTAVAAGANGVGIFDIAGAFTQLDVTATNVIAQGTLYDVEAETTAGNGTANVTLDRSDFGTSNTSGAHTSVTAPGSGTNVSAPPLFVNAAAANYHVLAGSPTVDTGATDPPGTDLDGRSRTLGPAPDMGAFELPEAPSVVEGAPGPVTSGTASFSASVNPQGLATTVVFVYTPSGGAPITSTAVAVGLGRAPVAAHVAVSGLVPHTAYSARAVASNDAGAVSSAALPFTTLAPAFAGVRIVTSKARLKKGRAKILLSCPASIIGPCTVSLKLTAPHHLGTAGKGRLTIAAGARRTLTVKISRRVRTRLKSGSLKVTARATAHEGAGQSRATKRTIKLTL